MARPLRIDQPGAWYHVTARGIDRRTIYRADSDRSHWLELMPEFVQIFRLRLHAYVLMDNHFHLLVEALEGNLSVAMQWLQTSLSWEEMRCRCGDWGRDLAWYLGRTEKKGNLDRKILDRKMEKLSPMSFS